MKIPKYLYYKIRPLILPINEIILHIPDYANILDLGCGKGLVPHNLKNYKSYTGVDLNVPINSSNTLNNINFIRDNCINYINQNLEKFDTFLVIDLLHHLNPNDQLFFTNTLLDLVKQGDVIIIKDIHPKNFLTKFWNSFHDLLVSKQIINYFNFQKFESNIPKNFKIITRFYKRIFLYDHYFLIIKKI